MSVAYIINTTGATIVVDTQTFTLRRDHINYDAVIAELNKSVIDEARILTLVDIPKSVKQFTQGKVEVTETGITFNGEEIHTGLANRILSLIREGNQGLATPLITFLENLMDNPSRRAVQGLYEWLENSNLPITPDGCFIAWKIVDPDFKDLRTKTFDNSPGQRVEIARNQVDEDPDRTCSYGLHFCSSGYLPSYGNSVGNKVVMVKVNPRDVVAFPRDYNTAKGRCCGYDVLSEISREAAPTRFDGSSGIYNPDAPKFKPVGLYSSSGKIILFDDASKEMPTGLNEEGDYSFEVVNESSIKLLPSGRVVTL